MRPLDGITVIDATQVVSGPFASMTLADLGAEVVKVERPDGGDIARHNPPFVHGFSTYFSAVNRNKRSVALDLQSEAGRDAFLALAKEADVVVENHPPGRMERFGLDYDAVREVNEDVIYCSITGFGQTGPYSDLPALDIMVQAMSGVMSITGPPDGQPYRAGIPIGDIASAMYAVQSILASLFARERGGGGEYIDVSMLESLLSWLTVRVGHTFGTGDPYPRMGNELSEYVPYGVVETADDPLAIVAATDAQWAALCDAIDRPDLATDDRFATVDARRENRETLDAILAAAFADRSRDAWFERLREAGVPAAPIYDTAEVWEDSHVRAREVRDTASVDGGSVDVVRYPARFRSVETGPASGPPTLGAHTREALEAAGYPPEEIDEIVEAIADHGSRS